MSIATCAALPLLLLLQQIQLCAACSAGEYRHLKPGVGFICLKCGVGFYSAKQSNCTACPYDYYSPKQGSSKCTACSAGKLTDNPGSAQCVTGCTKGKYRPEGSLSKSCFKCYPNTYQESIWQHECKVCPLGKFTQQMGGTKCTACDHGPCFCDLLRLELLDSIHADIPFCRLW
jgi:hypothetical protein